MSPEASGKWTDGARDNAAKANLFISTNWASGSMEFPQSRLAEYDHLDARERMKKRHGTQIGDPAKARKALYELAVMENPPSRVALGSDSYQVVMSKLEEYQSEYTKMKDFSYSTDIDHKD